MEQANQSPSPLENDAHSGPTETRHYAALDDQVRMLKNALAKDTTEQSQDDIAPRHSQTLPAKQDTVETAKSNSVSDQDIADLATILGRGSR